MGGWLVIGAAVLVLFWLDWTLLHVTCRRVAGIGGYGEVVRLVPVTVAALTLNLAVKSGGLAGLAMFAADGRRRKLSPARVSGAYLVAAVVVFRVLQFWLPLTAGATVGWWLRR